MAGRVTWFSSVWSWSPTSIFYTAEEKVDASGTSSLATTTIDFEDNKESREEQSFRRRNAVRTRTRKGHQQPHNSNITHPNSTKEEWMTAKDGPIKTIFDYHHPWKVGSFNKSICALPPTYQPVFRDAISGNTEQLQHYLESLEFVTDSVNLVNSKDDNSRYPIHFASAFGHLEVVKLLLSYGANVNALTNDLITTLACAAVNGNEKLMDLLIAKGADINYGLERPLRKADESETESHTALSWAVLAENIKSVNYLLKKGALLAGTTINWETPLHEAAYLGNVAILKALLEHERNLQSLELRGGDNKNTALHIAVEQGHLNCMELLLSVGANPNKFNIHGQTPLMLAAMTKDFSAMQLLIKNGSDVNTKDTKNRTPLHVLCKTSFVDVEWIECIDILLSRSADIDARDENGLTPFHIAVDSGHSTIVATLLKQGADLTLTNNAGQSGLDILVKKMPHAIRYIKESLDFAIRVKKNDIADPDCTISFDFRPIIVINNEDIATSNPRRETEVLLSFCEFGHKDILSHPLIEAFLILKWQRVMKYFWVSFIANVLMIITYSFFVFHLYKSKCPLASQNSTMLNLDSGVPEMPVYLEVTWYMLFLMIFVFMIKELVQLFSSRKSYFKMVENYIQLAFIILALMTILPDRLGGPINLSGELCKCLHRWNYTHYGTAAVSVVVAWLLILLRVGKLPRLGLYVQMLFKVVGNFGIFVVTYSSIVIAFTLSFGILFDEKVTDEVKTFSSIFHSFLSTMVMMTGELELNKVVQQTDVNRPLFPVTFVMFIAFLLLVTVVLMNLLVGLAVSDIQGLREGAKVARLSRLVVAIAQLETMLFSKAFKILPKNLVNHLRRNALLARKDKMYTFSFRPHDPRDTTLPPGVQLEALLILEKRENDRMRSMKKANKETDTKLELLEKMDKLEILMQNLDQFLSKQLPK